MGEGGLFVCRGRSLGSGLRSPWSSSYDPYHRRLHGGVCSKESNLLVEKERGLGKRKSVIVDETITQSPFVAV